MKIYALNGSPRKTWNTAVLLEKALEGAASQGAETTLIHLYDLNYKGCTSCFACKRKGGNHGHCAMRDDLSPVLEALRGADGIIFGSPVYVGDMTAVTRALLERLIFSHGLYSDTIPTVFPKRIPVGFIYTCNVTEDRLKETYLPTLMSIAPFIRERLGSFQVLISTNTYQFDDYAKYESSKFSEPEKARHKREQFPIDCQKAFDLGIKCTQPL
jgi:multimeric flavodoxin WrbA